MRGQCEEVATLSAAAGVGFLLKRSRWWCSREGEKSENLVGEGSHVYGWRIVVDNFWRASHIKRSEMEN